MSVVNEIFGNTGITKLKVFIEDPVDNAIDGLFDEVIEDFHLYHGDISPEQAIKLDTIKADLKEILKQFVEQNQNG